MIEPHYPANFTIKNDPDGLDDWLTRMKGRSTLGVDTETTGLKWLSDRVGGICLAANETAVYMYGDAMAGTIEWLAHQVKQERELVFHNAKFDLHMLYGTFGLHVPYTVHDTMVESFLLDNRGAPTVDHSVHGGHGLKNLASYYVDPAAKEPGEDLYRSVVANGGKTGSKQWKGDLLMGDPTLIGMYGLMDPWYTLKLHEVLHEMIRNWRQPSEHYPSLLSLYKTEQWLLTALVDMERTGISVEASFFEQWRDELKVQKKDLEKEIFRVAGKSFNPSSPDQVRHILYDHLRLPVKRWTQPKKTAKNQEPKPSTDEVALLDVNHDIGPLMLRYRDVTKQLGTYANGLLNAIEHDGRIHPNFKQTGARTGRLSCEDPNLQQVPRDSGARRGFVPDRGFELGFADYSQVEMRFAAHSSNDPTLVRGFLSDPGFDTHAATAMKMWGLIHPPTKEQRKFAKIMNFAMLYGAGEDKITSQLVSMLSRKEAIYSIKSFGVRPDRTITPHRNLAQLLIRRYFEEFPAIKSRRYGATEQVKNLGYSMNVFGRHRYLEDNESYKGFNSEVQGSAADLAKRGLANVYRELQHNGGHIACLLQIHDEIVYLSDGDPKIHRQVLEILNDDSSFRVPIVAEVSGSRTNWQEKKDLDLAT